MILTINIKNKSDFCPLYAFIFLDFHERTHKNNFLFGS